MRAISLLFHDVYETSPDESGFLSAAANRYKLRLADFDAQLEGVAHELEVHMRDLQAALRHGLDEAGRFQARDHLAHRAQRHVQQRHELALRDELAGLDAATEDLLGEALVGARTLAGRLGICAPGGRVWRRSRAVERGGGRG